MNKSLAAMRGWPWHIVAPVILFVLVAVLSPWIMPYDPTAQDYMATLQGPSLAHWLGTDYLGRDLLSRLIGGARVSLVAMSLVLASALVIGVVIGSLAGYIGGKVEVALISMIDIALALPSLVIALALIGIMGPGYWSMIAALTLAWWANYARMSRAVVVTELRQPYIEAARIMGAGHLHIFFRHILPNVLSPVMVAATLGFAAAIITESALSFLGLGFPPDFPTWGRLLFEGVEYMQMDPNRVLFPGLAISLTVLAINYIGDGLRDALDPRQRGR